MKLFISILLFISVTIGCGDVKSTVQNPAERYALYSDYFVFIADDSHSPLVIPIDLNWNANDEGYEIEFKSWYGTEKEWPIVYTKEVYKSKLIPSESFENKDVSSFKFNKAKKEITLSMPNTPEVTLRIPNRESWVLSPSDNKIHKETYAARTSADVNKENKSGWIIYERIRWKKEQLVEFGDFSTFFWIPLIANGEFYHFEQQKDERAASKWSINDGYIEVVEVSDFKIEVTETIADAKSGRKKIPKEVNISSEKNNLNISLLSTGQQAGYGKRFPKGLAYYRQSLLISDKKDEDTGHGMMELILENN